MTELWPWLAGGLVVWMGALGLYGHRHVRARQRVERWQHRCDATLAELDELATAPPPDADAIGVGAARLEERRADLGLLLDDAPNYAKRTALTDAEAAALAYEMALTHGEDLAPAARALRDAVAEVRASSADGALVG